MADPHDEDENALTWAGDESTGREGSRLPATTTDAEVAPIADDAPREPAPRSRPGAAALTALGAVLYLLLTVGWILGTQYSSAGTAQFWPQLLWQFGEFTAIVAAPLWFVTTLLLTSRVAVRAGWFALGLGVLLPWPVLPLLVVGA